MLSDIAAAGDAARVQLEQMGRVGQEFNQLHSRVDNINDRMTVLLKGIVCLISGGYLLIIQQDLLLQDLLRWSMRLCITKGPFHLILHYLVRFTFPLPLK
jgi:hypothetical protein